MPITPYLYYQDVKEALAFLVKAFGFRKYGPPMKGPQGKINHAAMKFGQHVIMMGYPGPSYKNPKRLGQTTQNLYVDVSNVDQHFARAKKAGAKILETPADTFYGHRRYGCEDPEGHHWFFACELKRKPAKKKRTAPKRPRPTG